MFQFLIGKVKTFLMKLGEIYIFGGLSIKKQNKTRNLFPLALGDSNEQSELFFAIKPTAIVWQSR